MKLVTWFYLGCSYGYVAEDIPDKKQITNKKLVKKLLCQHLPNTSSCLGCLNDFVNGHEGPVIGNLTQWYLFNCHLHFKQFEDCIICSKDMLMVIKVLKLKLDYAQW